MQSKRNNKITTSTKLITLFLIILTIIVAQSLFLNLALIVFALVFMVYENLNLNKFFKFIKQILIFLLIIMIIYILVFKNLILISVFTYKSLLIIIYIYGVFSLLDFDKLDSGINTLLSIIFKTKIRDKISFQISLSCFYISYFVEGCSNIIEKQQKIARLNLGLKYFFIPVLMYTEEQTKKLEKSLILNSYKVKCEKLNLSSTLLCFCFLIVFVIAIFKEVIF